MDLSLDERGRIDFVLSLRRRWAATLYLASHHTGNGGTAMRELHPELVLPDRYMDWDIDIQPGGVWRNDASAEGRCWKRRSSHDARSPSSVQCVD